MFSALFFHNVIKHVSRREWNVSQIPHNHYTLINNVRDPNCVFANKYCAATHSKKKATGVIIKLI